MFVCIGPEKPQWGVAQLRIHTYTYSGSVEKRAISNFRVTFCLGFKTSPRTKSFVWVWFAWKWNCRWNRFIILMVSHWYSFWHGSKRQLGNSPFRTDLNITLTIIHQIFSLTHDWSKHVTWPNIPQLKLGDIREYPPNFQNCARCEKDLKDNKNDSLHLGRKYALIFVLGHYLFLEANSFPRATLSENCSLLGTDNVRGQIS